MSEELVQAKPKSEVSVIFDKINTGLQAFEERKASLTKLVTEADEIKNIEKGDRAHLKKATEQRKKLKAARVEVEKEGKAMRDPLTNVNKQISEKQKELVDIVSPAEKDMEEIEGWYEAEEARLKREEEEKEQQRIQSRISRLEKYGFGLDVTVLMGVDDEQFDKIEETARVQYEQEQAIKAEQEKEEQRQREQDEKDRQELLELRKKAAEAEKIIREQQEELARKEAAIKAEEDRKEEERANAYLSTMTKRLDSRIDQIVALGLRWDGADDHFKGYGCFVPIVDIKVHSDEEWSKVIGKITPVIENGKKEEQARWEEEDRLMAEKQAAELEDIRKKAAEKALAEQKEKEAEEARQEAERLAQSSDKEKFNVILSHLEVLPTPNMKSAKHKKLLQEVLELRDKMTSYIKAKA